MNPRDYKGRGCDIRDSKCITNALHENGFASSKWAVEQDEISGAALCANVLAEIMHLLGAFDSHIGRIVHGESERAPVSRSPFVNQFCLVTEVVLQITRAIINIAIEVRNLSCYVFNIGISWNLS